MPATRSVPRTVRLLITFATATLACATPRSAPTPARVPAVRVLILTSQGVAPERDTAGYNQFVRKISQAFSSALEAELAPLGKQTDVVLNQDPAVGEQEVLVRSVTYRQTDAVIALRMENRLEPSGARALDLVARFMPLSYGEASDARFVKAGQETSWTFELTVPGGGGFRKESPGELVRPFVEALRARGAI